VTWSAQRHVSRGVVASTRGSLRAVAGTVISLVLICPATVMLAPHAMAVPAPEVEYTYNVVARRHFTFPSNDAIGYGYRICDKVSRGSTYADVMDSVEAEVFPNDEQASNYVVSYAVGILCPENISRLRDAAADYRRLR